MGNLKVGLLLIMDYYWNGSLDLMLHVELTTKAVVSVQVHATVTLCTATPLYAGQIVAFSELK